MTPFSRAHPLLSMLRAFTLRISQVTTQFYFFVHMLPLFTASHSLVAGRPASGCHLLLASSQGKVGSRNTETLAGLHAKPPAQRLAQQERHKRRVKMALLGGSSG